MLADSRGFFASENLQIQWTDVTPQKSVNKSEMYIDILERDIADLYHAADWVCIDRTTKSKTGWMVAKSPAQLGTLNSSFTLFSQKDSGISAPKDLAGLPIAVDLGTGSYYTALQDLERFISRDKINVVQIGEPSQRLVALLEGRVSGASLLSPWADIARALGMKEVLKTSRAGSTVLVARRDLAPDVLRNFFNAVNRAIQFIDEDPDSCREEYYSKIETILPSMPEAVKKAAESLKSTIPVPAWAPWEPFSEKDFELAYDWMVDGGLAPPALRYAEISFVNVTSLF